MRKSLVTLVTLCHATDRLYLVLQLDFFSPQLGKYFSPVREIIFSS